jgi:hypothetical protein
VEAFLFTQEISSMSLRFKGADLRPVLTEAIANQGSSQKTEKIVR